MPSTKITSAIRVDRPSKNSRSALAANRFVAFPRMTFSNGLRVHRCEVPLVASEMRPSRLLSMFRSPPASFAYSASVSRPEARCDLRLSWMLFRRLTEPANGALLPAVNDRATAIRMSSSVAMLFACIRLAPAPWKVAEPPLWPCDDPAGAKHSRPTLRFTF